MTAICASITQQERRKAIDDAKAIFDHDVQQVHDEELAIGADTILVKHLILLIYKMSARRPCMGTVRDDVATLQFEIADTCDTLEMVLRASSAAVGASFKRLGIELLTILVTLIDDEISQRVQMISQDQGSDAESRTEVKENVEDERTGERSDGTDESAPSSRPVTPPMSTSRHFFAGTPQGNILLKKATKIFGHFARVGEATKPMAYFSGLLASLLNMTAVRPFESIPWEARLSALWVLANLACNADNMVMMMCTPGLVNTLVSVACRNLLHSDPLEVTMEVLRARCIASRALLNLSWAPENKIPMSENAQLVSLLARLAVNRCAPFNRSRTVKEILVQTRRHSIGALRNLAAAPRRAKICLCEVGNGKVLDALTDAALNDTDVGAKNRAFAAIHNLAIHDTAVMMVERPALVLALKNVLLADDEDPEHEEGSPKSHASATLVVLERTITEDMSSYETLRELLDAVNPSVESDSDTGAVNPTPV